VVLGFSLVGYVGFVIYPRLDLSAGVGIGLLILAAAAGVASFFSPCSFALLVGMLARPVNDRSGDGGRALRTRDSLVFASALSLGVVAFLALLGTVIAVGGEALVKDVTFSSTAGRALRIGVGAFMIFVGLIQLGRVQVSLRRFEPTMQAFLRRQRRGRTRTERPFLRFVLFGFGYLAAGFG
jgi:cytochrome c-type biogenesis protein